MGFFKFLKREKKGNIDELDLPPAPPPLEGFDDKDSDFGKGQMPDFPNFDDNMEGMDFNPAGMEQGNNPIVQPRMDSKKDMKSPFAQMPKMGQNDFKTDIPEFPSFPDINEDNLQDYLNNNQPQFA